MINTGEHGLLWRLKRKALRLTRESERKRPKAQQSATHGITDEVRSDTTCLKAYNDYVIDGDLDEALVEALTAELSHLHHHGIYDAPESAVPRLLSLSLVVREARGGSAAAHGTALATVLERAIQSLAERDRRAAEPLFGLNDFAHVGLRDRHDAALKHLVARRWNDFRGKPFERFRRSVARALIACDADHAADSGRERVLGSEYTTLLFSTEYLVPRVDNPNITIIQRRRLRAEVDSLTHWTQTYNYLSESMTGPPQYSITGPGQLAFQISRFQDQAGDGYVADISVEFDSPLAKGEEIEFQMVQTQPIDPDRYWSASLPYFHIINPSDPIQRLEMAVRLNSQRLPRTARRLDGVPPSQRHRAEAEPAAVVAPGANARLASTWTDPRRKRSYGFTWDR